MPERLQLAIRPARADDAAGMLSVLNPLIAEGIHTVMDEPITLDEQRAYLRSFPARGVLHVAVDRDDQRVLGLQDVVALAGASRAQQHVGEISTFVALEARGQGIGRRLSVATFDAARALGFSKIMATIRADNPPAISFYASQGFRVIGTARKHALVRGMLIDEVLAEKLL